MAAMTNWPALISALQNAGWSQPQIAAKCGCSQATISDIATGRTKDPRYSIGAAIRNLAEECTRASAGQQEAVGA